MTGRVWAAVGLLSLIWGIPYYLIKIALLELSPACVAWGRVTLGALVLLPLAWRRGALARVGRHRGAILAFALVEVVGPFYLIATGERWVSSSLTAILIATAPLLVVAIAPLFGKPERPSARRLTGLLLGFAGVVALVGVEVEVGAQEGVLLGAGLILLAAIGYAIGPLVAEHRLGDVPALGTISVSLVTSSIALALPAWFTAPEALPGWRTIGAIVTLGWVCTATALVLFVTVISKAGASRASVIAYLAPMVAVLLGVVALDERFGVSTLVAMAMIFGGSWMATRASTDPSRTEPPPAAPLEGIENTVPAP